MTRSRFLFCMASATTARLSIGISGSVRNWLRLATKSFTRPSRRRIHRPLTPGRERSTINSVPCAIRAARSSVTPSRARSGSRSHRVSTKPSARSACCSSRRQTQSRSHRPDLNSFADSPRRTSPHLQLRRSAWSALTSTHITPQAPRLCTPSRSVAQSTCSTARATSHRTPDTALGHHC